MDKCFGLSSTVTTSRYDCCKTASSATLEEAYIAIFMLKTASSDNVNFKIFQKRLSYLVEEMYTLNIVRNTFNG